MYYKAIPGTYIFNRLNILWKRMEVAHAAAKDLGQRQGASQIQMKKGPEILAGGISAFRFTTKPKNYVKVISKHSTDCYFPAKISKNEALLAEIDSLPVVTASELNKIVNYHIQLVNRGPRKMLSYNPGVSFKDEMFIISIPDNAEWDQPEALQPYYPTNP